MAGKPQLQSGRSLVSALYSEEEMTAQALEGEKAYEAIRDVVEDPFAQLGLMLCAAHDVETSGLLSRRQIAAFVAWAIGADLNDGEPVAPPIPPEMAVRVAPLMTNKRVPIPRQLHRFAVVNGLRRRSEPPDPLSKR
jgi:hypothetical protein